MSRCSDLLEKFESHEKFEAYGPSYDYSYNPYSDDDDDDPYEAYSRTYDPKAEKEFIKYLKGYAEYRENGGSALYLMDKNPNRYRPVLISQDAPEVGLKRFMELHNLGKFCSASRLKHADDIGYICGTKGFINYGVD